MLNWRTLVAALLLMVVVPACKAVLPENGMYYNPSYQGLGYYIEVQGTTLVMTSYAYDKDTGGPLFYSSAGHIKAGQPGSSSGTPFGASYEHEYPYVFDAPFYSFKTGPCITCFVRNWDTSKQAIEAGHVHLRMSDVNRIQATFTLADGSETETTLWRQGFGRQGYALGRDDGRKLPDMRGRWVFIDHSQPNSPIWRFNFTEVEKPHVVEGDAANFHGRSVSSQMKFLDPESAAVMTCVKFGCAVSKDQQTLFLVKFWDIGMDSLLGYKGDELYSDSGSSSQYRSADLVIGKHVINPTPQAAPPPDE